MRVKMHWGSGTWQADHEEGFCTRKQAEEPAGKQDLPGGLLLSGARPQNAHITLPDRYLPGKGDITSPSVSYDGPRYACLNEGEVYDRLIAENDFGRFANSFLIIASKDGRQEKTIFAKYNRTRKEEFRIRTTMGNWTESAGWGRLPLKAQEDTTSFP